MAAETSLAKPRAVKTTSQPKSLVLRDFLPEPLPVIDFSPEDAYFSFDSLPPFPHPLRHPIRAFNWIVELLFGLASLFFMLAVLAAIPLLNFLALGYLLEAEGRVARTGKLRYAFPLLPLAPRLGSIALGVWLWMWPIRWITDAAADAQLIAPGTPVALGWTIAKSWLAAGIAVHLILALARGGGFWCFFRPLKNIIWLWSQWHAGTYFATASAAVKEFIAALKLRHHAWLGIRGFAGALAWLFFPTAFFAAMRTTQEPVQIIVTLFGGALLLLVLSWTPFLQAHFAAENRFSAFRELGRVRELFRRAPFLFFLSIVVLYALALPLYLAKVAVPPRDAMWMVTPIFIATIYPSRILIGWSYARAARRERRSWLIWRWPLWAALMPLLAFFIFLLFFTPAIGAYGRRVLFEHHALLLPSPF
jgi:hypothetical protein